MTEPIADAAPAMRGRLIGAIWLAYFLTAIVGGYLVRGLAAPTDAAATAQNILAHETLYRSGLAVGLVANAMYIALTALLYRLFAPVNRSISLVAAFFSLVGCATQIIGGLLQLAPLVILGGGRSLGGLSAEQLQALAMLSLKLYTQVFNISFVLFALFELTIGYLILRSAFLPRTLGVFMVIAGLSWTSFVWPPFAAPLLSYIVFLNLGELLLPLWLVVKGMDVARWREGARAPNRGFRP